MTSAHPGIEAIDQLAHVPQRPAVIFCDWHGVLCQKGFWHRTTEDPQHPWAAILGEELDRLFTAGNDDGRDWMCGTRISRDIVTSLAQRHDHLDAELLLTHLENDIAAMPVDQHLLAALRRARGYARVVLATDNIDVFGEVVRRSAHVPHADEPRLHGTAGAFDDVLSSSDIGVLKSENAPAFFGPWLNAAGLTFADAVLIDDRSDNCAAFDLAGGRTITWSRQQSARLLLKG